MKEKEYRQINSIKAGETVTRPVYIEELIQKETKTNKDPYVEFHICDGSSRTKVNKFRCQDGTPVTIKLLSDNGIVEDMIVMMRLTREKSGFFSVESMGPNTDSDVTIRDFAHKCDGDAGDRFENICHILSDVSKERRYIYSGTEKTMSDLALDLLNENKEAICWSSAAEMMHSEKAGGLMEHTEAMVRSAVAICDVYPDLDKDLLVAGAALHDIGKIEELKTNDLGNAKYTAEGIAIGHIVLGYTYVDRHVQENKGLYSDERVLLLKSMILSHHQVKEFGSPVEPIIPEAYMLSFIDNIDAKYHEMKNAKERLMPGEISPDSKVLGINHRIYRPKEGV